MENYVITISRRFGSNGHAVAGEVSRMLGIPVYDRSAVEAMAHLGGESADEEPARGRESETAETDRQEAGVGLLKGLFRREPKDDMPDEAQIEFEKQSEVIRLLAQEGPCIIIGRCADSIFRDHPRALHVFIYASEETRVKNSMKMLHTGEEEARALIRNEDRAREAYRKRFSGQGADEIEGRHLLIDSGKLGVEESAKILADAARYLFCG